MAIVTDPDNLDRFQVAVNPNSGQETISIRGLGTIRGSQQDTGESAGTTTFLDTVNGDFVTDSVAQGDILTIVSGTGIGHYIVASITDATSLVVDSAITGTSTTLTYKINEPAAVGGTTENVADGITMQAVYSFLKEEFRTLAGGLGNAPDLIQFTFPIESITTEQFEIGGTTHSDWRFADDTTRNLIRTGGWAQIDSGGTTRAEYTGIVTLGNLDSDAQVYYQQHATTVDPTNFVLTGAVNQAINTYDAVTLADSTGTGFVITTNDTIARNDGGNWFTDGYRIGGRITIFNAEDVGNNGSYTIADVENGTDGTLVVNGTPLTNNASDTTLEAAVNKRSFLKLFVRKKGRTYAQSEIADIGVTTIATIVNRFPLAHVVDAAISTRDGNLAGGSVFGTVTAVHSSASGSGEGITDVTTGDGLFEFTNSGALFTTTNRVAVGDVINFTSGTLDGNRYEIQAVTDATSLVLFEEPGDDAIADETAVSYSTSTRYIIFPGTTDGVNADAIASDGLGTLTSATVGDFAADGVEAGDYLRITEGGTAGASIVGVYKIDSVATTTLTVNISDNDNWATGTGIDFEILEPGMFLQQKEVTATTAGMTNLAWADANPDTLTRTGGSWITDGFTPGMSITVTNADTAGNNGTYIIDSVTATVITLIASESVITDAADTGAVVVGDSGFIRTLNQINYPFHWRLFGNGGTLLQSFEWLQKELRLTSDINEATTSNRGDITDLLMTFASPTGTGLDLFIDNLASSDTNNATFQDITADSRNFAFIAGVTITLNDNIINSSSAKVVVFFTNNDTGDNDGSDFGTVDAIIVKDTGNLDMTGNNPVTTLSFNFDYDNNVQRGSGSNGTDAPVTIVAIGTDTAQYVQATGTIQRQNNNTFALVAALERNYANP